MKKIIFAISACALIAIAIFLIQRERNRRPVFRDANILLITIDTVRPDYLSCYGSTNSTPNLDSIAKSGLLFENAFTIVPLTFPSHSSILTGLFPPHHSVHQNGIEIFNKKDSLITSALHQNGYKTGAVVSSFVLDRKFGLADGFDVYDDKMERLPDISTNFEVERPGNQTLNAAITILQQWKDQKWFLWVHFYDPHAPYTPPPPREGYAGEIGFVDEQVGKLLAWIRENQQQHPLIVAVTGDHGESLGEHGEKTHGFFVYNSTLKIPMMLS
jgi:arylsulfatase A-like enzyme